MFRVQKTPRVLAPFTSRRQNCLCSVEKAAFFVGNDAAEKRKRAQQKYRAKRAWRLNAAYFDSGVETEPDALEPDERQNSLWQV